MGRWAMRRRGASSCALCRGIVKRWSLIQVTHAGYWIVGARGDFAAAWAAHPATLLPVAGYAHIARLAWLLASDVHVYSTTSVADSFCQMQPTV